MKRWKVGAGLLLLGAIALVLCAEHVPDGHDDGWYALGPARFECYRERQGFYVLLYLKQFDPGPEKSMLTGYYHGAVWVPGLEIGDARNSEFRDGGWRQWLGYYLYTSWVMLGGLTIIGLLFWRWVMLRAANTRLRMSAMRMCAKCGYDLRASPGRCPECGTMPAVLHAGVQVGKAEEEWRQQQGGRGAMVEALLDPALNYHEFLDRLMVAQAVSIGATEAAVFRVGDGEEMELDLVGHLRGHEATAEVRARAAEEIREILFGVMLHPKGGVVEMEDDPRERRPMRCFGIPLYAGGRLYAVVGLVARASAEEARKLHERAEMIGAGYHEAYWMRCEGRWGAR